MCVCVCVSVYICVYMYECVCVCVFIYTWASLIAQLVKNPQCGRPGFDPWVRKIPWRRA